MANDTEKVLLILHCGNLHKEILRNTPQIVDVSSQDPVHISMVTQHAGEAAEKKLLFALTGCACTEVQEGPE